MTDQEAADILRNAGTEDGTTQEEFIQALRLGVQALGNQGFWKRWHDENLRLFVSRVEELEGERDKALGQVQRLSAELAKSVAMLNGESVELPLKTSEFRYVGKVKP